MFAFTTAGAWTSDDVWARFAARQSLADALRALEDAGAALHPLIAASDWQSEGIRALHELIAELADRTDAAAGRVRWLAMQLEEAAP